MNFAKSGYRRVKKTPEELKSIFLDTAKTLKIRENSIVRVPDGGGSYTEGRVLFIGDEDQKRSLDNTGRLQNQSGGTRTRRLLGLL